MPEATKTLLDAIIDKERCKYNTLIAAQIWNDRLNFFNSLGITLSIMSLRTGLNYNALWRAAYNLKMDTVVGNIELAVSQKKLLDQILPGNVHALRPVEAAELWQKNSAALLLEGITRHIFAHKCGLNANSLRSAIWRFEKSLPPSNKVRESKKFLERKIEQVNNRIALKHTADTWLNNKNHLLKHKASMALLTADTDTKITTYADISAQRQQCLQKKIELQQNFLESLVSVKNSDEVKKGAGSQWSKNRDLFKQEGITRKIYAQHCNVGRSNIDKLIKRNSQLTYNIPVEQQKIIKQIVDNTQCQGITKKAVNAYVVHEHLMKKHKIKPFAFARLSDVKIENFYYTYHERLRARQQPSLKQLGFLNEMMSRYQSSSDGRTLASILIKHKTELMAEKIPQVMFAKYNNISLFKLRDEVTKARSEDVNVKKSSIATVLIQPEKLYPNSRRRAWEKLSLRSKKVLEGFISDHKCVGNIRSSAKAWQLHNKYLQAEGIEHLAFSYRCQIVHRNFINTVNRLPIEVALATPEIFVNENKPDVI